jgi:squalene-hopene/tetraprenyl-beta-curcumene cyclase
MRIASRIVGTAGVMVALGLAWSVSPERLRGEDAPKIEIAPNSPDEPLADKLSLEKAASFLDGVSLNWTRERKWGTCHTNYAFMISRPALKEIASPAMIEIRTFFEQRVAGWDNDGISAKPRWDTEVVATAAALAMNDAATTGRLHPRTRQALDRMWTLQRPDGAWNWLKCNWPPYEHDDYYGAVFAAIGVGVAPEEYRNGESARKGLDKLRTYLHENPAPDLHHRAFLLWASTRLDGLMTPPERETTIRDLLARQRDDGGWNLPSLGEWKRHDGSTNDANSTSDGYGTGAVVYILRQAGLSADHPAIRRGADWLRSHQRSSGRWFTRSLSTDKNHYITHAGTGFAVLALQACEAAAKP